MDKIVNWLDGWNVGGKTSIIWFALLAAFLVLAAIKIVKNADVLTKKTKFGGGIIGGVLIAIVTAAPEFITSIQQSLDGNPGTASADNIGANAITAFTIGLTALIFIREMFLNRLKKWTIITLWISFAVSVFIMMMMLFNADINIGVVGKYAIGLVPLALLIIYFILLALQMKFADEDEHMEDSKYIEKTSVKKASWLFLFWGVLLILGSIVINITAISIEHGFGLSQQSIGGLFLSFAMALPEAVAFIALIRSKQYSAAVAVLVGHGFALFVSEWLGDAAFKDAASYTTTQVHDVWPIAAITTAGFGGLALAATLPKKFKIFNKSKVVYAILPTIVSLAYVVGWVLILTLYF